MKISMKLFVSSVLFGSLLMASTAKVSTPKETKGTTIGKYAKPGASVDLTYTAQNVDPGEVSEVNIVLRTAVKSGQMKVVIKSDKGLDLSDEIDKNLRFTLDESRREYPLKLFVSAQSDGVYYVKLLVSITGQGARSFAVPVYIGEGRVKKTNKALSQSASGEKLSVSKAVESSE